MISLLGFNSLYAFEIKPMFVTMKPDEIKTITISSNNPKEFTTYRMEVEGKSDSGLTFQDVDGKDINAIVLKDGKTTFKIKAPNKEGNFILAFDSRPLDKLNTGELFFARQGLSITVAQPKVGSAEKK